MNDVGVVTPELMRAMVDDYRRRQMLAPQIQANYPQRRSTYEPSFRTRPAVIGTTLTAPASSLVSATTCTAYFLDLQADGTQVLNTTPVTIYNDDPEVTAEVGTYCRLLAVNSRWMIMYLGCDPQQALVDEIPA